MSEMIFLIAVMIEAESSALKGSVAPASSVPAYIIVSRMNFFDGRDQGGRVEISGSLTLPKQFYILQRLAYLVRRATDLDSSLHICNLVEDC